MAECRVWAEGGAGGQALAEAVAAAASAPSEFRPIYPNNWPLTSKIEALATKIYSAARVEYSAEAAKQLALFQERGYGGLPVVIAKTHLSLNHDPKLGASPSGYAFPIQEVRLAAGAGFVYALAGEMRTMPGLPAHPAAERIDLDADGLTVGLS